MGSLQFALAKNFKCKNLSKDVNFTLFCRG